MCATRAPDRFPPCAITSGFSPKRRSTTHPSPPSSPPCSARRSSPFRRAHRRCAASARRIRAVEQWNRPRRGRRRCGRLHERRPIRTMPPKGEECGGGTEQEGLTRLAPLRGTSTLARQTRPITVTRRTRRRCGGDGGAGFWTTYAAGDLERRPSSRPERAAGSGDRRGHRLSPTDAPVRRRRSGHRAADRPPCSADAQERQYAPCGAGSTGHARKRSGGGSGVGATGSSGAGVIGLRPGRFSAGRRPHACASAGGMPGSVSGSPRRRGEDYVAMHDQHAAPLVAPEGAAWPPPPAPDAGRASGASRPAPPGRAPGPADRLPDRAASTARCGAGRRYVRRQNRSRVRRGWDRSAKDHRETPIIQDDERQRQWGCKRAESISARDGAIVGHRVGESIRSHKKMHTKTPICIGKHKSDPPSQTTGRRTRDGRGDGRGDEQPDAGWTDAGRALDERRTSAGRAGGRALDAGKDGRWTSRRTDAGRTPDERRTSAGRTPDGRRTSAGRALDGRRTSAGRAPDERWTDAGRALDGRRTNGRATGRTADAGWTDAGRARDERPNAGTEAGRTPDGRRTSAGRGDRRTLDEQPDAGWTSGRTTGRGMDGRRTSAGRTRDGRTLDERRTRAGRTADAGMEAGRTANAGLDGRRANAGWTDGERGDGRTAGERGMDDDHRSAPLKSPMQRNECTTTRCTHALRWEQRDADRTSRNRPSPPHPRRHRSIATRRDGSAGTMSNAQVI